MPNYNSISRYNLTTATIINYVDKIKTLLSNNNIIKIKQQLLLIMFIK